MKHRVRIDMSFDSKADAQSLMDFAKKVSGKAVSISEGSGGEEISFCDMELCRHDEGLPCTKLERLEVRTAAI
ncbi:MAG: hypothetical protein ABIK32_04665 [Chloroflexota bacterium]|nr:hypothetical protein [Chloroflexota bacterium]